MIFVPHVATKSKICNKCGKQFCQLKNYKKHIATKDELTNCDLCDFKSCTKAGMATHMKFHNEKRPKNTQNNLKRPYQCNKCNKRFHNKANLELHMKTKDKLKMCESCDFKSCTKLGFSYHMKKVHGIKLPKLRNKICCNFCDYKTDSKAWLDIHMKSKDEPKICEYCDFKSCTKLAFSIHMKKVHGIKLHNKTCCNFCDYKTEKKANLEIHMKSKDEPTICEHCDFKSCTKLGFSNHMKKVHGIKPKLIHDAEITNRNCNKCGKQFSHIRSLEIHMATKDELTNCDLCDFKSCTKIGMSTHKRNNHGIKLKMNIARIFNCIKCDQKFYSKANLEFHEKKIRDEILPCSKCDFKSCTKTGLIIHLRNVHEISSDAVENVPDSAMILDVLEQKPNIPITTYGRFMVQWNIRKIDAKN
jgi:KRAB domain-containing zinc finger protein